MNKQVPTLKKPTRIFSKRRTSKWWVWQYTPAWGTAFLFVVGSLFFLIGSSMRLFRVISDKRQATRVFVLTPYFLGSFCYTSGCALPLPRTFLQWRRSRQQPRRKARGRSDREVEKARIQNYLAKIDFIGAVMAVTGGLFINSATSVDLYLVRWVARPSYISQLRRNFFGRLPFQQCWEGQCLCWQAGSRGLQGTSHGI